MSDIVIAIDQSTNYNCYVLEYQGFQGWAQIGTKWDKSVTF